LFALTVVKCRLLHHLQWGNFVTQTQTMAVFDPSGDMLTRYDTCMTTVLSCNLYSLFFL